MISNNKFKLTFNHPMAQLMWAMGMQEMENTDNVENNTEVDTEVDTENNTENNTLSVENYDDMDGFEITI